MAKQIGGTILSGRVDNIVYYQTKDGRNLARRVYEHTGKKVKTAPEYGLTRKLNDKFDLCSRAASIFYQQLFSRFKIYPNRRLYNLLLKNLYNSSASNLAPIANDAIVPLVNNSYNYSNLTTLEEDIDNGYTHVTYGNIYFEQGLIIYSQNAQFLYDNGVRYIGFSVDMFGFELPTFDANGNVNLPEIKRYNISYSNSYGVTGSTNIILVQINHSYGLHGINANYLCNINGGSTLGLGGISVNIICKDANQNHMKDFDIHVFAVPKLIS